MGRFLETAFYLLVWRAILAGLIAVVLMVTRSFEFVAALQIGANVALLFSLGLIAWSQGLTEQRVVRTLAWRRLRPDQRPAGEAGRRWARRELDELTLRFAKAGSVVAVALSASALVIAGG